ncbi:ATP-binding protein, variant 3 [Entomophthora muscae]|uniref:ATP-binding protein, variant 3 n=1 Tax=Entomophthora muscae TaxID=34485 RepID=A0ACC2U4P4_9FUNG|nr:ATP-binding protein, variant 3 [Entomophthora muscae]
MLLFKIHSLSPLFSRSMRCSSTQFGLGSHSALTQRLAGTKTFPPTPSKSKATNKTPKANSTTTINGSKDKPPSASPDISAASHHHIYTSKLDNPAFSSYGGGFEHIDVGGEDETEGWAWNSVLHNPRLIVKHLDEYVIGQERAKRILAVAVFNHYNRVRANLKTVIPKSILSEEPLVDTRIKDTSTSTARVPLPVTAPSPFQYHQLKRSWINPSTNADPAEKIATDPIKGESTEAEAMSGETIYDKSNVLLLGPTGSGKTLLARTLANVLKVPFSMSDATPFTQAGYVGEDVELVIQRLLQNCDFDVKKAEQGIVFIDEIDKIARRPDSMSISKDVSGEGVQQALLRMLEGTNITITDKTGGHGPGSRKGSSSMSGASLTGSPKGDTYTVNTSNILFILSGAFIGLDKIVMDRVSKSSIGFDAPLRSSGPNSSNHINYLETVEPEDLTKYGLIPEFIGRLPVLASVATLDEQALIRVLTEPRNSLIKQYEGLFRFNKVSLFSLVVSYF